MTTQLIPSEDILCSTKSSILLGFLTNLNINYLPSCTNATGNLVDTNYSEEDAFHIVIKNLDQHTIHLLSYCVRYSRQRSLIGLTSSMEECNSKTCPLILIRKYTILLSTPPVLAAKGGKRIPWLICDAKYIDIVIDQSLLSCTTYLDTTFSSSMKAYNPFGPTGLLKQVFTGNSFLIPDGFVGVVVSIELLLEHYKNNSDAKAFSTKAKGEDKYSLVLRDYFYPDTISVYAEFSAIKDLTVGMIVKVPSCLLCMPASKKNLYVKLHTPNVIG